MTRMSQRDKVLAAIKAGPVTNFELNKICYRYSARIYELREEGHQISTHIVDKATTVYTYRGKS